MNSLHYRIAVAILFWVGIGIALGIVIGRCTA